MSLNPKRIHPRHAAVAALAAGAIVALFASPALGAKSIDNEVALGYKQVGLGLSARIQYTVKIISANDDCKDSRRGDLFKEEGAVDPKIRNWQTDSKGRASFTLTQGAAPAGIYYARAKKKKLAGKKTCKLAISPTITTTIATH